MEFLTRSLYNLSNLTKARTGEACSCCGLSVEENPTNRTRPTFGLGLRVINGQIGKEITTDKCIVTHVKTKHGYVTVVNKPAASNL